LAVGLLVMLAVAGLAVVRSLTQPPHRIGESGYQAIKRGMTLKEVEEVVGVPPGDYGPMPVGMGQWDFVGPARELVGEGAADRPKEWHGGGCMIRVFFDRTTGRVMLKELTKVSYHSNSLIDFFRRTFRL
jgi:hypothetical protein